jgi:large subunit ribosomal protein L5
MNQLQKKIYLEKLVFNTLSDGAVQEDIEKYVKFFTINFNRKPAILKAKKNIKNFNIRPNRPLGRKLTLRKQERQRYLGKILARKDFKLWNYNFSQRGSLSLGIKSYVDIPGFEYNPDLGFFGLHINIQFRKPGIRIKNRLFKKRYVGIKQRPTSYDVVANLKEKFPNLKIYNQ